MGIETASIVPYTGVLALLIQYVTVELRTLSASIAVNEIFSCASERIFQSYEVSIHDNLISILLEDIISPN
jgi:hypothetical protein